jgi:hypothetical protein
MPYCWNSQDSFSSSDQTLFTGSGSGAEFASGIDNATKAENCLRDTSGRRAKSLERRIGAEAIRRIITACRSGRMAAGAIGGISENAPTRLSPAYEAEEPSALR